ncbi:MAG TPA: glycosyltransferase family 2 protein [Flavipsychrobacter sp.]|nr:glycosyltransferase family 2 protein [Flavipsychrobacter sp.]
MEHPVISIVTPTFNQGHLVEETIVSVLDQMYPHLEYIIMDGGSTDNTVEIIKKYEKYITMWRSEPDCGQADAINKGLRYCTGTIFNWLNSDDYLEKKALFHIAGLFRGEVDAVAGGVRIFSSNTSYTVQNRNLSARGILLWNDGVDFVQPGVWLRRECIPICGGIDERYHYSFDWDFYIRYLYFFGNVLETDKLLVHFRLHDSSKTTKFQEGFVSEQYAIAQKILLDKNFSLLHQDCIKKLQGRKFAETIDAILNTDADFHNKIINILKAGITYKRYAFSRIIFGALRKVLKQQMFKIE